MYHRKRSDLISTIHSSLSPLFLGQLKNLHKAVAAAFAKELPAGLTGASYDFAEVVANGTLKARTTFIEGAKGDVGHKRSYCSLRVSEVKVEDADWEYEHELGLVEEDLSSIADRLRADETKKMVNAIEVSYLSFSQVICIFTAR